MLAHPMGVPFLCRTFHREGLFDVRIFFDTILSYTIS